MWQESQENKPPSNTSDMIELSFSVDCKELPYDHAFELSSEILNLIPEIKNDKRNAIQTLHGPMSGNGWVDQMVKIYLYQKEPNLLCVSIKVR